MHKIDDFTISSLVLFAHWDWHGTGYKRLRFCSHSLFVCKECHESIAFINNVRMAMWGNLPHILYNQEMQNLSNECPWRLSSKQPEKYGTQNHFITLPQILLSRSFDFHYSTAHMPGFYCQFIVSKSFITTGRALTAAEVRHFDYLPNPSFPARSK